MKIRKLQNEVDTQSLQIAGLVGMLHAGIVLWLRSMFSVLSTPMFDPYVLWAFIGLTLVGTVATYVVLVHRLIAPLLGLGAFLGWILYQQRQYVESLNGNAWATIEPLSYYSTYWPLPLGIVLLLAALEWGGRKLVSGTDTTVEEHS